MSFESYPTAIKEAVIAPALAPANRLIWLIIPSSSRAYNKQEVVLRKSIIGDKWKIYFILQLLKIMRTGIWNGYLTLHLQASVYRKLFILIPLYYFISTMALVSIHIVTGTMTFTVRFWMFNVSLCTTEFFRNRLPIHVVKGDNIKKIRQQMPRYTYKLRLLVNRFFFYRTYIQNISNYSGELK